MAGKTGLLLVAGAAALALSSKKSSSPHGVFVTRNCEGIGLRDKDKFASWVVKSYLEHKHENTPMQIVLKLTSEALPEGCSYFPSPATSFAVADFMWAILRVILSYVNQSVGFGDSIGIYTSSEVMDFMTWFNDQKQSFNIEEG